jgi:opacity protein-like surface antigen
MKRSIITGFVVAVLAISSAYAQDWYHDRDARYQGNQWRSQVFMQVKTDLDHIWSARGASEKENQRLDRTKEELMKMQGDLDQGRFDNGILNDVIDSLKKSADDERLAPRDRAVLSDDLNRLHDYQQNHNHWNH